MCLFSTFLRLQRDDHCACAQEWCHFSYFFKSFHLNKKLKALRPKMTKIASRGSCLKSGTVQKLKSVRHKSSRLWKDLLVEWHTRQQTRAIHTWVMNLFFFSMQALHWCTHSVARYIIHRWWPVFPWTISINCTDCFWSSIFLFTLW